MSDPGDEDDVIGGGSYFMGSGTAEFDWTPLKKRVADELNGEVLFMDVIVPTDVIDPDGWALNEVAHRFVEARVMRRTQGDKARCIQIHVHYPDPGEYISHLHESRTD